MLKQYHEKGKVEVGLDEAGRGCLFGPVCIAGVVWNDEDPNADIVLKDSKKCSEKYRKKCYDYIIENCIGYSIQLISHEEIDKKNILECTIDGMHKCLDDISDKISFDTILVDGDKFRHYYNKNKDDFISHKCIVKGDNTYKSIAAASILAKTYRDNYIEQLVRDNEELKKYKLDKNKGYGTKEHMEAIQEYGVVEGHRRSFKPCY
jgi:ribonuclease HII